MHFLEGVLLPEEAKKKVKSSWKAWRLVTSGYFSYTELKQMDMEEVEKANAAIEYESELRQQSIENNRKRKR